MGGQLFPLADRILDGNLAEMLKTWRAEGASHEKIARLLATTHGIDVSGETVRSWTKRPLAAVRIEVADPVHDRPLDLGRDGVRSDDEPAEEHEHQDDSAPHVAEGSDPDWVAPFREALRA